MVKNSNDSKICLYFWHLVSATPNINSRIGEAIHKDQDLHSHKDTRTLQSMFLINSNSPALNKYNIITSILTFGGSCTRQAPIIELRFFATMFVLNYNIYIYTRRHPILRAFSNTLVGRYCHQHGREHLGNAHQNT